jgi:membrane protein implicated in regulation of membrane protease activity
MSSRMRAGRIDGWLAVIYVCVAGMAVLVVGAFLHWPVPWWIYAVAFSLCLLMPLWLAWRYRRVWHR